MKRIVSILLLAVVTFTVNAQEKDPTLLIIGGKDVKLSEFNAIFNKNNSNNKATDESIQEYLDLYVKFKLKVREAEELGYDTLPKFISELKGYRKQLAQPYLTDKEVTESLIKEAYDRMKEDIRASHILITLEEGAIPSDTLAAYNKALQARKKILSGQDFAEVAKAFSNDPSAQKNGGDLGYFSALHMVYPFETAAYTTKVGDVSMPIKTRFGYHIIKVVDRRPARGTIKAAHIMVKADRKLTGDAAAEKKQKIDEIYEKLTKDEQDFATLAKQFSDDKGSARRGGELKEFNAGKMVAEFEDAAFGLAKDDDFSKPIQTDFGWHIIKRLELKELDSYENLYNVIKAKVSRDSRSNKSKEALLKKIKEDNGFVENLRERNDFYKLLTKEDYIKGDFKASATSKYNKLMFGLYAKDGDKVEYTQTEFASYLENIKYKSGKRSKDVNMKAEINRLYNQILENKAIEFKNSRLSKTNEEFRLLMNEYRDGILLFDLTDEKVWSKAVKDTSGLESFYQENKTKYMWKERVEATIYVCNDESIAKTVSKILKKKAKKGYSNEDILKMVNTDSQLSLKIEEGKYSKGDNEDVDKAIWKKEATSTLKKDKSVIIIEIKNVLVAEPKQLKEIKGLITSDYQNHLEQEWVKELKGKYEVVVDTKVLKLVK
ncbi:MAG: peptidylprolyl isomerase [Flavobacteriales bacterium]|nr:peptidylprolyl isomerase [Flavobacteriales bacterium]